MDETILEQIQTLENTQLTEPFYRLKIGSEMLVNFPKALWQSQEHILISGLQVFYFLRLM